MDFLYILKTNLEAFASGAECTPLTNELEVCVSQGSISKSSWLAVAVALAVASSENVNILSIPK